MLVVTADDDPEALQRARSAGASGVVTKPVDVAELLERVGALLQ